MPTKLLVNLDGDFNIRADGLGVVIELSKGYLFEYGIEYGIEYGYEWYRIWFLVI